MGDQQALDFDGVICDSCDKSSISSVKDRDLASLQICKDKSTIWAVYFLMKNLN